MEGRVTPVTSCDAEMCSFWMQRLSLIVALNLSCTVALPLDAIHACALLHNPGIWTPHIGRLTRGNFLMQLHAPPAVTQTAGLLPPAPALLRRTVMRHQTTTTSLLLWCWAAGRRGTAATATDSKLPPQTAGLLVDPHSRARRSSAASKRLHLLSKARILMKTAARSGWSTGGTCQLSNSGPQLQMQGSQAQPSRSL